MVSPKVLISRLGLLIKDLGLTAGSIRHLLPKFAKLLICLLFLLNIRSWPLMWHCKSFQRLIEVLITSIIQSKIASLGLSLFCDSNTTGYLSAQSFGRRRESWRWKMIGGTRCRRLVKTRLEWLYRIVRGQVSELSFYASLWNIFLLHRSRWMWFQWSS